MSKIINGVEFLFLGNWQAMDAESLRSYLSIECGSFKSQADGSVTLTMHSLAAKAKARYYFIKLIAINNYSSVLIMNELILIMFKILSYSYLFSCLSLVIEDMSIILI